MQHFIYIFILLLLVWALAAASYHFSPCLSSHTMIICLRANNWHENIVFLLIWQRTTVLLSFEIQVSFSCFVEFLVGVREWLFKRLLNGIKETYLRLMQTFLRWVLFSLAPIRKEENCGLNCCLDIHIHKSSVLWLGSLCVVRCF